MTLFYEVKITVKSLKINDLGLDIIGRDAYGLYKNIKGTNPSIKYDDKWSNVYYLGGKPYLRDGSVTLKRKFVSSNKIDRTLNMPCVKGNTENQDKKHGRKVVLEKVSMFIDAENIGAQHIEEIIRKVSKEGEIIDKKYYTRQNDKATAPWNEAAKKYKIKKISVYGKPEKDKNDNKIKQHIRKILHSKKVKVICIVTSDSGYIDIVNEIKKPGKKAIIVGEKKAPKKLRDAATKFIELSPQSI